MITSQTYGLVTGQVSTHWSQEPTVEDIDVLVEYLALYRAIIAKKSTQAPSVDQEEKT